MALDIEFGYTGQIVRVNLSKKEIFEEKYTPDDRKKWIGGTGLGATIIWEEVLGEVSWDSPANKFIFATGPLTGTGFNGAGGFSLVGKGPMTNLAGCSQAHGYFGAYLKFCGFDALIIEGASFKWIYLLIDDGRVSIR